MSNLQDSTPFVTRVYAALLDLYPPKFRHEFGGEMLGVLAEALDESAERGPLAVLTLCVRELVTLPAAALCERAREWSIMANKQLLNWTLTPVPRRELLAAFALYLLMASVYLTGGILQGHVSSAVVQSILSVVILGVLGAISLIGVYRRFPAWSLPTLGFLCALGLGIASTMRPFSGWQDLWVGQIVPNLPAVLRGFADQGRIWLTLLVTPILIIVLSLPRTLVRRFLEQFKSDWSRFSFLLYGAMPWLVLLSFDEYRQDETYLALAALVLMLGAGCYLVSARPWQRLLVLLMGTSVAMLVVIAGKWLILPHQTWPMLNHYAIDAVRNNEAIFSVVTWMWALLLLLVSALLGFLFRSRESPQLQQPAHS